TIAAPVAAGAIYRGGEAGSIVADCEFPSDYDALLADRRFTAVVLGPGLGRGEGTGRLVRQALQSASAVPERRFVLDADALTWAGHGPGMGFLRQYGERCVLTPHEGEFSILFSNISADLNKLEKARHAAQQSGAVVLLKGADTVIAAPDGRAIINANAPASLATAGSGDVLAGMIGGLLAQGLEPFAAAAAGAYLHGAAGQLAGANLVAEDLPQALSVLLRDHWKSL
ncbi:MAG: NAD(P)H-hydrate dehydratase, partial [Rhodospirillales bacterium]